MTTQFHTSHATGAPLTAVELNAPLGQLDAVIGTEMLARVAADATIALSGSGVTTALDGSAAASQKVIPLVSTTGILAGASFFITDGTNSETGVVDTISAGVV